MIRDDVRSEVESLDVRTGWATIDCVACGRSRKMRVCMDLSSPLYSYYQCWSPSCGVRGFFDRGGTFEPVPQPEPADPSVVELPEGFELLTTSSGGHKQKRLDKYRRYLFSRNVSQFLIDSMSIGCLNWGRLSGSVVLPYYKEGCVIGWVARSIYEKRYFYPKGWSKTDWPYNGDVLFESTDLPAVVVEGQFDALNLYPLGVAVGGQPTEKNWELLLRSKRPLVLCFDADEGRKSEFGALKLKLECVRRKLPLKISWVRIPPGTDPGSLKRESLLRRVFASLGDYA